MAKLFTRADVATHTGKKVSVGGKEVLTAENEPYIIIHNVVYNVTEWLNDHPGGNAILIENAGTDATQAFEDQGHSHIARDIMKQFIIGEVVPDERKLWIRVFKEIDTQKVKLYEFHYTAKDHSLLPLAEKMAQVHKEHGISSEDARGALLTLKDAQSTAVRIEDELEASQFPIHVKYLAGGGNAGGGGALPKVAAAALIASYVAKSMSSGPVSSLTYSKGVRHAHALMIFGMASSIWSVRAATRAEDKDAKQGWMEIHKGTGVLMLLGMVARIWLRLQSAIPGRFPGPAGLAQAETLSHKLFYVLMLALPTSGVAYGYFSGSGVPILGLAKPNPTNEDMGKSGSALDLHRALGRLLEYLWLPFHFAVNGYHYSNGRGVVRKITPFT
jgi:cytochrome b561